MIFNAKSEVKDYACCTLAMSPNLEVMLITWMGSFA
jgi:hypothetical protein